MLPQIDYFPLTDLLQITINSLNQRLTDALTDALTDNKIRLNEYYTDTSYRWIVLVICGRSVLHIFLTDRCHRCPDRSPTDNNN